MLDWNYENLYFNGLDASNPSIAYRGSNVNDENQNTITIDTSLQGNFQTGGLSHTLLLGLDYRKFSNNILTQFGYAPSINILAPVYNQPILNVPWYVSQVDGNISQTGIYAQDQIRYGKWLLTVGLRQTGAWTDSTTFTNFGNTEQDQDDQALTGRVGLTYLFDNGIAPYFSYSNLVRAGDRQHADRAGRRAVPALHGRAI